MKTTHTPGPWTIHWGQQEHQLDELRIYGPELKKYPNAKALAVVATVGPDFSHANADIMAAAPEMLSVLHRVLGYLSDVPESSPMLKDVKAVIAKAKGDADA